jgi:hypothetical protein
MVICSDLAGVGRYEYRFSKANGLRYIGSVVRSIHLGYLWSK